MLTVPVQVDFISDFDFMDREEAGDSLGSVHTQCEPGSKWRLLVTHSGGVQGQVHAVEGEGLARDVHF